MRLLPYLSGSGRTHLPPFDPVLHEPKRETGFPVVLEENILRAFPKTNPREGWGRLTINTCGLQASWRRRLPASAAALDDFSRRRAPSSNVQITKQSQREEVTPARCPAARGHLCPSEGQMPPGSGKEAGIELPFAWTTQLRAQFESLNLCLIIIACQPPRALDK